MTEETPAQTTEEIVVEARAVLSPDGLPRRRAARTEEPKPKPAPTTKYIVINGAIAPHGGGPDELIHPGSVVELTAELAKHYNNLGYLKPYIED